MIVPIHSDNNKNRILYISHLIERKDITLAIVDDHNDMRETIAEQMNNFGFNVIMTANNGERILQQLDTEKQLPDVCIMDLNMPVMDGFAAIEGIRQKGLPIGVVAISMNNTPKQVQKAIDAGADGFFLTKPNH